MRIAALVACACWAASLPARGDALMPPPDDCPAGTLGLECHGPPLCLPIQCSHDSDCESGLVCRTFDFCVYMSNCCGGWGEPCHVPNVQGFCGAVTCDYGSCEPWNVCIDPGSIPGADVGVEPFVESIAEAAAELFGQPEPVPEPAHEGLPEIIGWAEPKIEPMPDSGGVPVGDGGAAPLDIGADVATAPVPGSKSDGCSAALPAGGTALLAVLVLLALLRGRRRSRTRL